MNGSRRITDREAELERQGAEAELRVLLEEYRHIVDGIFRIMDLRDGKLSLLLTISAGSIAAIATLVGVLQEAIRNEVLFLVCALGSLLTAGLAWVIEYHQAEIFWRQSYLMHKLRKRAETLISLLGGQTSVPQSFLGFEEHVHALRINATEFAQDEKEKLWWRLFFQTTTLGNVAYHVVVVLPSFVYLLTMWIFQLWGLTAGGSVWTWIIAILGTVFYFALLFSIAVRFLFFRKGYHLPKRQDRDHPLTGVAITKGDSSV